MKVTIELEDDSEVYFAINGSNYWNTIWDLDQWLRAETKYNEELSEEKYDAFDLVREKIREFLNDNKVKLDV